MTELVPTKRTIFCDTETTGRHRERRQIWEIGLIVRDPGQPDVEYEWQIRPDLTDAEEVGLRIGGYYRRNQIAAKHKIGTTVALVHPDLPETPGQPSRGRFGEVSHLADELAPMFDGAQVVGFCPWFDEHSLWRLFRDHGHALVVDYHLVDVESMSAGFAHAAARWAPDRWIDAYEGRRGALERIKAGPGWQSSDLGLAAGVPAPVDRHRALVDARWSRDVMDVITGYHRPGPAALLGEPMDAGKATGPIPVLGETPRRVSR